MKKFTKLQKKKLASNSNYSLENVYDVPHVGVIISEFSTRVGDLILVIGKSITGRDLCIFNDYYADWFDATVLTYDTIKATPAQVKRFRTGYCRKGQGRRFTIKGIYEGIDSIKL